MIWTGVIMLVVGSVLIVGGIVGVVASAASLVSGFGSPVLTPATVPVHSTPGPPTPSTSAPARFRQRYRGDPFLAT